MLHFSPLKSLPVRANPPPSAGLCCPYITAQVFWSHIASLPLGYFPYQLSPHLLCFHLLCIHWFIISVLQVLSSFHFLKIHHEFMVPFWSPYSQCQLFPGFLVIWFLSQVFCEEDFIFSIFPSDLICCDRSVGCQPAACSLLGNLTFMDLFYLSYCSFSVVICISSSLLYKYYSQVASKCTNTTTESFPPFPLIDLIY